MIRREGGMYVNRRMIKEAIEFWVNGKLINGNRYFACNARPVKTDDKYGIWVIDIVSPTEDEDEV